PADCKQRVLFCTSMSDIGIFHQPTSEIECTVFTLCPAENGNERLGLVYHVSAYFGSMGAKSTAARPSSGCFCSNGRVGDRVQSEWAQSRRQPKELASNKPWKGSGCTWARCARFHYHRRTLPFYRSRQAGNRPRQDRSDKASTVHSRFPRRNHE